MSPDQIYAYFYVWLAIGAVVIVVAAALLIAIIVCARRITRLAGTALAVVAEIEQNTKPVWQLNASHKVAGDLAGGTEAIHANAGAIAEALGASGEKDVA